MPRLKKLTDSRQMALNFGGQDNTKEVLSEETKTNVLKDINKYFQKSAENFGLLKTPKVESTDQELTSRAPQLLESEPESKLETNNSKVTPLLSEQAMLLKKIYEQLLNQNKHTEKQDEDELKLQEEMQEKDEESGRKPKSGFLGLKGEVGETLKGAAKGLGYTGLAALVSGAVAMLAQSLLDAGKQAKEVFGDWKGTVDAVRKQLEDYIPGVREGKETEREAETGRDYFKRKNELQSQANKGDKKATEALKKMDVGEGREKELATAVREQQMKKEILGEGWQYRVGSYAYGLGKSLGVIPELPQPEDAPDQTRAAVIDDMAGDKNGLVGKGVGAMYDFGRDTGVIPEPPAALPQPPAALPQPPAALPQVTNQLKDKISESGTGISKTTKQMLPTPTQSMHISDLKIITQHENFVDHPYPDGKGISIGYGTRIDDKPELLAKYGTPDKPKSKISKEEATKLLKEKVTKVENAIYKNVKVPIPQGMFDQLVDFGYNVGEGALQEKSGKSGSTLITKLNKGDYQGAIAEFPKWNKSQGKESEGLTSRRQQESQASTISLKSFNAPAPPQVANEPSQRGEKMAATSTANALANLSGPSGGSGNSVIIAPKTNISNNQTSMMLPVNVNNGEDTHTWATRSNYVPV